MLMGALDSVRTQTVPPKQTIVVVDYNVDLYKRLIFTVPDAVIVGERRAQGPLRRPEHGTAVAKAEIVAFLDDDAEAAPDWLERLAVLYDDPDVLAVGGLVEPLWEAGRPGYFAKELDWIVAARTGGCPRSPPRSATSLARTCPSFRCARPCRRLNTRSGARMRSRSAPRDRTVHPRRDPSARIPGVLRARSVVPTTFRLERGTLRYMLAPLLGRRIPKAQVSRVVGRKRRRPLDRATFGSSCPGQYLRVRCGLRRGPGRTRPAGGLVRSARGRAPGYVRARRCPRRPCR